MDTPSVRSPHAPLVRSEPERFSARYGHGASCCACGGSIGRYELEYELGWEDPARTVRMHARCYELETGERSRH